MGVGDCPPAGGEGELSQSAGRQLRSPVTEVHAGDIQSMTDTAHAAFTAFCLDPLDIPPDNIDGLTADFLEHGIHQGTIKYVSHTDTEITVTLMLLWGTQEITYTLPRWGKRFEKREGLARESVLAAFSRMAKKQADEEAEADTQPGVPVDLGAIEITRTPQLGFAETLLRIKKLKAELESLGCTVKVTMTGDGAAIKAANWLLSRPFIEQG